MGRKIPLWQAYICFLFTIISLMYCLGMKKLAGILWKRNHKSSPGSPLTKRISEILCRMRLFNLKMELIP